MIEVPSLRAFCIACHARAGVQLQVPSVKHWSVGHVSSLCVCVCVYMQGEDVCCVGKTPGAAA